MQFRDEYWFLSNMYPCDIAYNGFTYSCVESAFQAQKDASQAGRFSRMNGYTAKRAGRSVNLRSDWEDVKLGIMKEILEVKFSNPELKAKLLGIEGPIVEDNAWGDRYWGKCNGVGENHLGQLLSEVREEIMEKDTQNKERHLPRREKPVRETGIIAPQTGIEVPVGDFSHDRYYPELQEDGRVQEDDTAYNYAEQLETGHAYSDEPLPFG